MCRGIFEVQAGAKWFGFRLPVVKGGREGRVCYTVSVMEVLFIVDTANVRLEATRTLRTHWSVVSWNWTSPPPGVFLVCAGMKIGPRGASKSVDFGGGSLYLIGAGALPFLLCFCEELALGSGVALPLVSGASDPPFDSRFFSDSFFALDARSRARGASSWGLDGLKSGFRGEETAGW